MNYCYYRIIENTGTEAFRYYRGIDLLEWDDVYDATDLFLVSTGDEDEFFAVPPEPAP